MAQNYKVDSQLQDYLSDSPFSFEPGKASKLESNTLQAMKNGLDGIEGAPYQFMPSVDRRIPGTSVGRKYAEKIYTHLPLLFLTPVEPLFMDDFNREARESGALGVVQSYLGNTVDEILGLDSGGKYYSVDFNYQEYWKYANTMLNTVAKFLFGSKANDIYVRSNGNGSKSLANYDYQYDTNNIFGKTFFSDAENIVYYVDGFSSVDESFSNGSGESSLASTINQYSSMANEIRFLFGSGDNVLSELAQGASDVSANISSSLSTVASSLAGGIIGSLSNKGVSSVLNGGKIIFPKIWSDSSYDKSYSFTIKLRSPDHDSFSIFWNVLKPYCKLLAMVMPRQIDPSDPNAYGAPFLTRAYVKGMVNVEMGMISSMSVTKGDQCCWNDDGLPTQIDISVTIEDMYTSLMMSKLDTFNPKSAFQVASNTSYMDFLANMAGLNTGKMQIGRRIEMVPYLLGNQLSNIVPNTLTGFESRVSKGLGKLYSTL